MVVVFVEGVDGDLDLRTDAQVGDVDRGGDLPHHHHLLFGELDGGEGEGLIGVGGGHVGSRGLVPGVGVRPDAPGTAELDLFEVTAATLRVATEDTLAGEGVGATRRASASEQGRMWVGREPAFDRRHPRLHRGHSTRLPDAPSAGPGRAGALPDRTGGCMGRDTFVNGTQCRGHPCAATRQFWCRPSRGRRGARRRCADRRSARASGRAVSRRRT